MEWKLELRRAWAAPSFVPIQLSYIYLEIGPFSTCLIPLEMSTKNNADDNSTVSERMENR